MPREQRSIFRPGGDPEILIRKLRRWNQRINAHKNELSSRDKKSYFLKVFLFLLFFSLFFARIASRGICREAKKKTKEIPARLLAFFNFLLLTAQRAKARPPTRSREAADEISESLRETRAVLKRKITELAQESCWLVFFFQTGG